jgi:hypothetical protein
MAWSVGGQRAGRGTGARAEARGQGRPYTAPGPLPVNRKPPGHAQEMPEKYHNFTEHGDVSDSFYVRGSHEAY